MDLSERPTSGLSGGRRHPWEVARFRFFNQVLANREVHPRSVLDAGAGDGWFASQFLRSLAADAQVTCWDAHYTSDIIDSLAVEADPRVRFVAERPNARFELILLLDVLEHVQQDGDFLATLVRENLADRGVVLVSVPAWQRLFSAHDVRMRHFRRYAPSSAARLLAQSGLAIVQAGGLFHTLVLSRAATALKERVLPPSETDAPAPLEWKDGHQTRAVEWILGWDNRLSQLAARVGIELPGLSWWALCQKP
jgi:hypothetical protein